MFWGWRNGLALKEHALLWKRTQVWFLAPISHACQPLMTLPPRELTLLHTASVAFLCSIQCRAYCGETASAVCSQGVGNDLQMSHRANHQSMLSVLFRVSVDAPHTLQRHTQETATAVALGTKAEACRTR